MVLKTKGVIESIELIHSPYHLGDKGVDVAIYIFNIKSKYTTQTFQKEIALCDPSLAPTTHAVFLSQVNRIKDAQKFSFKDVRVTDYEGILNILKIMCVGKEVNLKMQEVKGQFINSFLTDPEYERVEVLI